MTLLDRKWRLTRTEKRKNVFVYDRYGTEVYGGAEAYCRQLAEKLTAFYDVIVYIQ